MNFVILLLLGSCTTTTIYYIIQYNKLRYEFNQFKSHQIDSLCSVKSKLELDTNYLFAELKSNQEIVESRYGNIVGDLIDFIQEFETFKIQFNQLQSEFTELHQFVSQKESETQKRNYKSYVEMAQKVGDLNPKFNLQAQKIDNIQKLGVSLQEQMHYLSKQVERWTKSY